MKVFSLSFLTLLLSVGFVYGQELQLPVGCPISQHFADSYDVANHRLHLGEDRACAAGTPVNPIAGGVVVRAGDSGISTVGNVVVIRHELSDGSVIVSTYWHLQTVLVSEGLINKNDLLGTTGVSGSGPHLHWEIRVGDNPLEDIEPYPNEDGEDKYAYILPELTSDLDKYTDPSLFIELYNRGRSHRNPSQPVVISPVGEVAELEMCMDEHGTDRKCIMWDVSQDATHYDVYVDNIKIGRSYRPGMYFPGGGVVSNLESSVGKRTVWVEAHNAFAETTSDSVEYHVGSFVGDGNPIIITNEPDLVTEESAGLRGILSNIGASSKYFFEYLFLGPQSESTSGVMQMKSRASPLVHKVGGASTTRLRRVPRSGRINTVEALVDELQPNSEYEVRLGVIDDTGTTTYSANVVQFITSEDAGFDGIDLSEASLMVASVTCTSVDLVIQIPDNVTRTEIYRNNNGTNRTPDYATNETGHIRWSDTKVRTAIVNSYDVVFSNADDEQEIADVESYAIDVNDCLEVNRTIGLNALYQMCDGDQPVTLLNWVAPDYFGPLYVVKNITTGSEALVDASQDGNNYLIAAGLAFGETHMYQVSTTYEGETVTSNNVQVEILSEGCGLPADAVFTLNQFPSWAENPTCVDGNVAVTVRWGEYDGAEMFSVYRGMMHPVYESLSFVATTSDLVFTDTGLEPGSMYAYHVSASGPNGSRGSYQMNVVIPGDVCDDTDVPETFDLSLEPTWCSSLSAKTAVHWSDPGNVAVSEYHVMDGERGKYAGWSGYPVNPGYAVSLTEGAPTNIRVLAYSADDPEKRNWSQPANVYVDADYCEIPSHVGDASAAVAVLGESSAFFHSYAHTRGSDGTVTMRWGQDGLFPNVIDEWEIEGTYWNDHVRLGKIVNDLPCQRDLQFQVTVENQNGTGMSDIIPFRTDDCTTPQPPTVELLEPDGVNDVADESFLIKWLDDDVDSNAAITFSTSSNDDCSNATEIATRWEDDTIDRLMIDTSSLESGSHYILGSIQDETHTPVLDCVGPIMVEHHEALFIDEFNDESLDVSKWSTSGNSVTHVAGVTTIANIDSTTAAGMLTSVPITIDPNRLVIVERIAQVTPGVDRIVGHLEFQMVGASDKTFGVAYANYYTHNLTGTFLYRNSPSLLSEDDADDRVNVAATLFGEWFHEYLVYDPVFGMLTYHRDGEELETFHVGSIASSNQLVLSLDAWGDVGGIHDMDRISVYQEDRLDAWERDGVWFTDQFDDGVVDGSLWSSDSSVSETGGSLVIPSGSSATTQLITLDPSVPIEVSWRETFTLPLQSYVTIDFAIPGSTTDRFGYGYFKYDYTYQGSNQQQSVECRGIHLHRYDAAVTECHDQARMSDRLNAAGPYYTLVYHPITGYLKFFTDDLFVGEYFVGVWNSVSESFTLTFTAHGNGSELRLHELTVRQDGVIIPDPPEPPEPTVLFSDDFNDDSINTSVWSHGGSIVTEVNGVLQLDRLSSSNYSWITSMPFTIDPSTPLTMTRRVKWNGGSQHFHGHFDLDVVGYPEYRFGLSYSTFANPSGLAVFGDDGDLMSSRVPVTNGSWYVERLAYDPVTGDVTLHRDDILAVSYNVGALPAGATEMVVHMHAWGWSAGHYQHVDYVNITQ